MGLMELKPLVTATFAHRSWCLLGYILLTTLFSDQSFTHHLHYLHK